MNQTKASSFLWLAVDNF